MSATSITGARSPVRPDLLEGLTGVPNRITLVRTVVSMLIAAWAFHAHDWRWLVAGYLAYWVGDMLDGAVARMRDEETVVGAVLDVICDRANTLLLAGAFIAMYDAVTVPLTIFLVQFAVPDTMLTLAFLLWPGVSSPNYFHRVDRPLYRWNWSKPAKAGNTSAVVLSLVLGLVTGVLWPAYLAATLASAVKLASVVRLLMILRGRIPAAP